MLHSVSKTTTHEASTSPATSGYDRKSPFRPARQEPLLTRTVPVTAELPRYRGPSARRDALAGVTVAALAIPSAMAYAEVAGLSPVNGLYALLLPAVAYAFLGSSTEYPYRRFLLFSAIGGTARAIYTCVLAYFVSTALADFALASIVISGLITSLLVGTVYWIDRHRHADGGVSPAVVGKTS